jgi:aryl-alcohol dehydrogenase-like predicted oxidoreductase
VAKLAAEEAGSDAHHFTTIQLPLNLVETEGLACAKWAKSEGLRVLVNRPLNAFKDNLSYRLATYEMPNDYDALLNETIHFLEEQKLDNLVNVLTEMDGVSHRFGWVGEYESFLMRQILPAIQKMFQTIADEDKEAIANALQAFLDVYAKKVAYESSKTTLSSLKALGIEVTEPMQKTALEYLLHNGDIDCVLLGMRKVNYVQEALSILEDL